MSNDAIVYTYANHGFPFDPEKHAKGYTYVNVLADLSSSVALGKVVGLLGRLNIPVVSTYANILQQVAGSTRHLEDGTTARHLEDGTTERTLE